MKTALIYHIFCTVNGKCYIGQTWRTLEQRWKEHKKGRGRSPHLKNAITKYGIERFVITTLTSGLLTQEQADQAEIYWIQYFDSINNGYNVKEGGSAGAHSEETKAKIGASGRGRKVSPESIAKMKKVQKNRPKEVNRKISEALMGNKNAVGNSPSEETLKKRSESLKGNQNCKGRVLSEETKAKIGASNKGKKRSDEARAKMRAAKLGKKRSKVVSEWDETMPPGMAEARKKAIDAVTLCIHDCLVSECDICVNELRD